MGYCRSSSDANKSSSYAAKLKKVTLIIYTCSIVIILFAEGLAVVVLSRLIAGISIGGEYTAIFAAVDEFVPASYRGRVDIIIDGSWHIGGIAASLISMGMNTEKLWKWMFGLGLFGVLPIVILRRYVPESPRWLLTKGRER